MYGLWLLFYKTKQAYAANTSSFVSKGAHIFAKAYGKNFREAGQLPTPGSPLFDALSLLVAAKSQVLYCGLGASFTLPNQLVGTTPTTTEGLAVVLEAGFFFPGAPLLTGVEGRLVPGVSADFPRSASALPTRGGLNGLFSSATSGLRRGYSPRMPLRSIDRFLLFRAQGGVGRNGLPDSSPSALKGPGTRGYRDTYKLPTNVRSGYLRLFKQKSLHGLVRLTRSALINHTGAMPTKLLLKRRLTRTTFTSTHVPSLQSFSGVPLKQKHRFRSTPKVSLSSQPNHNLYPLGPSLGSVVFLASNESAQLSSARGGIFRQPIIRYKPGLSRYWRAHRFTLQRLFSMFAVGRQRRLTAMVSRVSRVASFSFFKAVELSLLHIVFCSKLGEHGESASMIRASFFVAGGFAYLNGRRQWCPYVQLYQGDVLFLHAPACIIRPPHTHRTGTSLDFCASGVIESYDNPIHLEVDELTSSCVVLFEPQRWGLWGKHAAGCSPHITLKLYNWKYST